MMSHEASDPKEKAFISFHIYMSSVSKVTLRTQFDLLSHIGGFTFLAYLVIWALSQLSCRQTVVKKLANHLYFDNSLRHQNRSRIMSIFFKNEPVPEEARCGSCHTEWYKKYQKTLKAVASDVER